MGIAGDGETLGEYYAGWEIAGHAPGAEAVRGGADGDVWGVAYSDGFLGGYGELNPGCFAGDEFAEVFWEQAPIAYFGGTFQGNQHHVHEG